MADKMNSKEQAAFKASVEASQDSVDDLGRGLQQSAKNILDAASAAKQYASELDYIRKLQEKAQKAGKQGLSDELAGQIQIIKALQQKDKKMQAIKKAYGSVNDEAQDLIKSVETFVKKLPGGDFIVKMFGIDKLGSKFKDVINKQAKKLYESLGGSSKMMGGLGKLAKGFGGFLAAGIGAALVAFLAFEQSVKKVAQDMGVSHTQAKLLTNQIKQAVNAEGMILATTQDALDVATVLSNEFGTMAGISPQLAADVAEMGKAFGYSAKTAGQVQVAFESMGMESGMAVEMQRELAAEATKAGVNVGAVMDDIAQNSKKVAKFFGGNVKALKDAAIQAAKLGVNLDTMAGVADHLLDFEKSIAAQFELQALTGKNINLDLARQLALEGDIAGATKAVLDQVGDIHDFNNMDYLARKKLAEASGMSVEELQKSLTIQSKLGDLTEDQAAAMNNLGLSAAQIAEMSPKQLQDALAQQAAADKMTKQVDKLKNVLMKALLPIANELLFVFEAMGPVLSLVGSALGLAFKPIGMVAKAVGSVLKYFQDHIPVLATLLGTFTAIELIQRRKLIMAKGEAALALATNTYLSVKAGLLTAASAIQKKGLMVAIGQAAMTAFSSLSAIPFVGAALGAVAAAGAVALGMAYMSDGVIKGDDTVSRPKSGGKGGYGSRVLFGPEGAISFNNKDTIVAGTNLNYKMNDGVIAPQGALKVNDYASDMPDPPETKIIEFAPLVAGIAMGLGAMLMQTLPLALIAGFGAVMPILTMAMTAGVMSGMVAGAMATAFIPKPVLLVNPFIMTFETNPIMLMGNILGGLFGGGGGGQDADPSAAVVKKLDDVIFAIENMEINMDGQKVGGISRLIDSFRRR
jgi:hypothetical protein